MYVTASDAPDSGALRCQQRHTWGLSTALIQLFRASELPPDVPGMIVTDGDTTALLLNPAYMTVSGNPWMQQVANTLLSVADTATPMAVV